MVYPGATETVLRIYVCKRVEGVDYLLADFRVQCAGSKWSSFRNLSAFLIFVYPVRAPAAPPRMPAASLLLARRSVCLPCVRRGARATLRPCRGRGAFAVC